MFCLAAHNAVVTSAIFAPHPDLIVPQEPGAEKPDAECKSDATDEAEPIPSGNACNHGNLHHIFHCMYNITRLTSLMSFLIGALKTDHTEVLLSADFTGAIKVFVNVKKY